jgi:hypothetical protein
MVDAAGLGAWLPLALGVAGTLGAAAGVYNVYRLQGGGLVREASWRGGNPASVAYAGAVSWLAWHPGGSARGLRVRGRVERGPDRWLLFDAPPGMTRRSARCGSTGEAAEAGARRRGGSRSR